MLNLGKVKPGSTIYIPFETFSGSTGAPITLTGLAVGDIKIYKDGGTTERASTSGFTLLDTDGIDFDAITGIHGVSIDLADNTTADFYAAGSRYFVVIGDVTVDSQTMRFLAARFEIAYPDTILDTTIATLASQTSFTLTTGPADNNALVGCTAIIHDAASAVQMAMGIVSAYTGSTKTVTLAVDPAIFTMAAKDNISFFPRTNANIIQLLGTAISTPATAGIIDVNVKNIDNDAASANGTVTFPNATLASTTNITAATGITVSTNNDKTGYGLSSAAVQAIWDALTSALTTVGSIGKLLVDNINATISSRSTYAGGDTSGTTTLLTRIPSALTITTGKVDVNDKTGFSLSSGGIQAIWDAATSALTTVGSIGKWLLDKLDVVLSTRLATSGYTAPDNATITAIAGYVDTEVAAIKAKTDNLPATPASTADCITAAGVRTAVGLASANMDTQLAAIQADTDNLQTRIPAALVSGRMDASVGAMATDSISAAALSSAAADKQAAAIFKLDLSTLSGEALRSLLNATRKQMNRVKKNTGTTKLEIYKEDDTTVAFYQTYTESSGAIVEVNTD